MNDRINALYKLCYEAARDKCTKIIVDINEISDLLAEMQRLQDSNDFRGSVIDCYNDIVKRLSNHVDNLEKPHQPPPTTAAPKVQAAGTLRAHNEIPHIFASRYCMPQIPSKEWWTYAGDCSVCGAEIHLEIMPSVFRALKDKKCHKCAREAAQQNQHTP